METTIKPVFVWHPYCNGLNMFGSECEVVDTPDPQVKIFRFKEGCTWGGSYEFNRSCEPGTVQRIAVFNHWCKSPEEEEKCNVDIKCEGHYRVTACLDVPPGYIVVLEGTTKPEPKAVDPVLALLANDAERTRLDSIENTIALAVEKGGRMVLSALKRKTNSYRFGEDWDKALQNLVEQGELETETDEKGRVWVSITSVVS